MQHTIQRLPLFPLSLVNRPLEVKVPCCICIRGYDRNADLLRGRATKRVFDLPVGYVAGVSGSCYLST